MATGSSVAGRGSVYEVVDRVAWWRLRRPDAMNAIDDDVVADLEEVTAAVEGDDGVHALVVTGEGEVFSVGMDLEVLAGCFDDLARFRAFLERLNRALCRLEALPVPVVAAVNGTARAGGFELLLACHLVVVADEARIADHHAHFGVVPGGGATQRAPRKLGQQRARALLLTGRWLEGRTAVDWGLALRSVPRADLDAAVEELLAELRSKPRSVLTAIARAIDAGADLPIADAVALEVDVMLRHVADHPWGREGFDAFREGRPPRWP